MNASVEITDGKEILNTVATRMNRLIKEKVDAVLVYFLLLRLKFFLNNPFFFFSYDLFDL